MSEKELWNQLKRGNKTALASIYNTYFSDLFSYGRRFAVDTSTVEDAIQELFVELWERRENLSPTDKIKPYLLLSLKRKIFQKTKAAKRLNETQASESHFEAVLAIDHDLIQVELAIEQKQGLRKAFEQLSSRQKEILYLKYYSGLDYDEITEIMDMNYQSARNLVSRALVKLGKHLPLLTILLAALALLQIGKN